MTVRVALQRSCSTSPRLCAARRPKCRRFWQIRVQNRVFGVRAEQSGNFTCITSDRDLFVIAVLAGPLKLVRAQVGFKVVNERIRCRCASNSSFLHAGVFYVRVRVQVQVRSRFVVRGDVCERDDDGRERFERRLDVVFSLDDTSCTATVTFVIIVGTRTGTSASGFRLFVCVLGTGLFLSFALDVFCVRVRRRRLPAMYANMMSWTCAFSKAAWTWTWMLLFVFIGPRRIL